jgi:hypothetical protein
VESVSDEDIQLLESYLDDALTEPQIEALRQRLASEPALAQELVELRSERSLRQSFFQELEPPEAATDDLMNRVRASVQRQEIFGRQLRGLRLVGAAAACLVIGFTVGRFREGPILERPGSAVVDSTPVLTPGASGQIEFVGTAPRTVLPGDALNRPFYRVALTDDSGRTTAVQQFNSIDEARRFTEQVNHQARQGARRGGAVLIADEF